MNENRVTITQKDRRIILTSGAMGALFVALSIHFPVNLAVRFVIFSGAGIVHGLILRRILRNESITSVVCTSLITGFLIALSLQATNKVVQLALTTCAIAVYVVPAAIRRR